MKMDEDCARLPDNPTTPILAWSAFAKSVFLPVSTTFYVSPFSGCLDVSDAVLRLHTPGIAGFADPMLRLAMKDSERPLVGSGNFQGETNKQWSYDIHMISQWSYNHITPVV